MSVCLCMCVYLLCLFNFVSHLYLCLRLSACTQVPLSPCVSFPSPPNPSLSVTVCLSPHCVSLTLVLVLHESQDVCLFVCIYACVSLCVCLYICICVFFIEFTISPLYLWLLSLFGFLSLSLPLCMHFSTSRSLNLLYHFVGVCLSLCVCLLSFFSSLSLALCLFLFLLVSLLQNVGLFVYTSLLACVRACMCACAYLLLSNTLVRINTLHSVP